MSVSLSGLASGFDWTSFIQQMIEVEGVTKQRLESEQTTIDNRKSAYSSLQSAMTSLQTAVEALSDRDLYRSRTGSSSDTDLATVVANAGASLGSYEIDVSQRATAASLRSATAIAGTLHGDNDVSDLTLNEAPFSSAIEGGTFTVNGKSITVTTSNSLQDVFDDISEATGGEVTASYDSATDSIQLTSASEIVLGSATDSSNFLAAARLYNNGSGTVTSASTLGAVRETGNLEDANLATTLSEGTGGSGLFRINGIDISWDAHSDSLANVMDRINNSGAGVTATYDRVNDKLVLTNNSTGDMGISVEDVSGNFLAATGITTGTLERGKNLLYTIDDGPTLQSLSNTISEDSSGLSDLSVDVLKIGSFTASVTTDTDPAKEAIETFVSRYNRVQSLIDTYTASSTDADGKVTSALLSDDNDPTNIGSALRARVNGDVSGLSGVLKRLSSLGITSSGYDNNLTIEDEDAFADALSESMSQVEALFTDETDGIATRLGTFLKATVGDDGTLVAKQDLLTKQIEALDLQIAEQEEYLTDEEERLKATFVAMETAQSKINAQLTYLQSAFGSS